MIRRNDASLHGRKGRATRERRPLQTGSGNHNVDRSSAGTSIPVPLTQPAPQQPDGSAWAWTRGDARLVAEGSWAFEVLRTAHGRMSIGIAGNETGGLIPNISIPVPSNGRKRNETRR